MKNEKDTFEEKFGDLRAVMQEMCNAYEKAIIRDFTELMDRKHGKATGQYPQTERFASLFEVYKEGRGKRAFNDALSNVEFMLSHGYCRNKLANVCEKVGLPVDFQEDGYRGPDPKIQEAVVTAVVEILQDLRRLGH